jgi:hypothetical protein
MPGPVEIQITTDPSHRRQIEKLLREEEAKLKTKTRITRRNRSDPARRLYLPSSSYARLQDWRGCSPREEARRVADHLAKLLEL